MSYTKIKELGRGGFGLVTEVTNQHNQRFAMKEFNPSGDIQAVIDKGIVSLADIKKRFFKEVKYQSQVKSRNVVQIIESDLKNTVPWYVMELGVGTLKDDLTLDRTLGENLQTALFDILAGLEAIHSLDITHRDLKPVNVLKFNEENGSVRYAISDFGLITTIASDTTTITQTGHGGGTPIYAAPELMTNFKYATPTADIYSFGAILHDIFGSGYRTPYVELTVPGPFRAIVEKCTKTRPQRRYQDITSLRIDVYDALNHPDLSFSSNEEAEIVKLLNDKIELEDNEWDRFFEVLDHSNSLNTTAYNLFRALRSGHIDSLASTSSDLFNALGMEFSEYVRSTSHDFDYCDVLADKLERFFKLGLIGLKAHILLSLLKMGVNHNRWFAERKFLQLAGPNLDESIVKRILIDVEAEPFDLDYYLSAWEISIKVNRIQLHPLLAVCK